MFFDDGPVAMHLSRAVAEHLRWCRRQGITPPPELADLLAALEATSGPERPGIAPPSADPEPLYVGYEDAAARLSVSSRTVRRMVTGGRLPARRIGRRRVIAVADLVALAQREGARGGDAAQEEGPGPGVLAG